MDKQNCKSQKHAGIRRHSCIIGIDPGLSGGIAVYDPIKKQIVAAWPMPTTTEFVKRKKKRNINKRRLNSDIADACAEYGVQMIAIERVASSPQMGNSSAFKFGQGFGNVEMVAEIYCNNVAYVTPQKWKARLMVSNDKKHAIQRAQEIMGNSPHLKKDGQCEAALIAYYAAKDLIEDEVDPLS